MRKLEIVLFVGRLLSPGAAESAACSGEGGVVTLQYEVVYARPSAHLAGRVAVDCACAVLVASRRMFAKGELHDLQVRVGSRLQAVSVQRRTAPVAVSVSVAGGYSREQIERNLERKLPDLPCRSAAAEISLPIRVRIGGTGMVSLAEIDPAAPARLRDCVLRASREWDFGYALVDERGRHWGEVAFVIIFPRAQPPPAR
jgi:hypothetical protein